MSRFSATASMIQSHSASLGRSSSKLPGVMSAARDGSKKAAGLDFESASRALRASCGSALSGFGGRSSRSDRDSGVGQVGGDAGAHGSGAENGGAADEQRFGAIST